MPSNEVTLGKLTRREFRERMESGELKSCIIPVAATEQHLEHLAMEHDWRSVQVVSRRVAERLAPHVLVAEALQVGVSEHHMNHPGTLTLRPGTFLSVVNDLIRSMQHAGFTNILVLNGHGGNIVPCQSNWAQFVREFKINVQFLSYWDVLTQDDALQLKSGNRIPEDLPGHAQEFETAIALEEFPENVREDINQEDKSPQQATAELGKLFLGRIVTRVASHLSSMMDGSSTIEIPDFHP